MTGNFTRFIIEKAVDRALMEMKKNSKRELRNLVELGMFHSISGFQDLFYKTARRLLSDQNCPYYSVVFDMVANVDTPALKRFGINLGYNAWTAGVRRIREYEKQENCGVPWMLLFDMMEKTPESLTQTEIRNILLQAREIGIYSYLFMCDNHNGLTPMISELLTEFQDCVFFVFLDPAAITSEVCIICRAAGNIMPVVAYTSEKSDAYISATALLKSERCLYGSFLRYGDGNTQELLDKYSSMTGAAMPPATFLLRGHSCTEETASLIQSFVEAMRTEPVYPTFFVDFYRDFAYVDTVISNRPEFFSVSANGGVCVSPYGNALGNIRIDDLLSLLRRLLPRPAQE